MKVHELFGCRYHVSHPDRWDATWWSWRELLMALSGASNASIRERLKDAVRWPLYFMCPL